MNKKSKILIINVVLFLLAGFYGCKEKEDGIVTALTIKEGKWVSTSSCMVITLKDNATLQLTPFIMPRDAANQTVKYAHKYTEFMEVSESGLITGKSPGVDTLTVSATDGSGISTWYRVVITDHKVKATAINVTAAGSNISLKVGGAAFDLGAQVTLSPADTWDKTVTYKSNNEAVATVSESGIVTPAGIGATTITVTTADGSNISRNVNVTVLDIVQRWNDIDRTGWTVTSVQGNGSTHLVDGTTGLAEHMFNDNNNQFLSMFKPGGSNAGQSAPPIDFKPYFIVDIKTSQTFNYFKWHHRGNNVNNQLKVFAVHLYGSNDGVTFTQIVPEEPEAPEHPNLFWIPAGGPNGYVGNEQAAHGGLQTIEMPEVNYRHIKVEIMVWSNIYRTTPNSRYPEGYQYYQHPKWPGNGNDAWGNAVQIAQFGLGHMFWD